MTIFNLSFTNGLHENLVHLCQHQKFSLNSSNNSVLSFSQDVDLKKTVDESARIQRAYRHYFDLIIVNDNLDCAFEKLQSAVDQLCTEPQWVPVSWVYWGSSPCKHVWVCVCVCLFTVCVWLVSKVTDMGQSEVWNDQPNECHLPQKHR